jgi:cation:H+ antiporter
MLGFVNNSSLLIIAIIFIFASAITWVAGITLAKATDTLDTRWKIGDALGGLVLLGIAGSLPETAVVWSAAANHHIPVIIGNLIGGLAIQTLVIVIFDIAVKGKQPLSYHAGSKMLSFETIFAMLITALALVGFFIPARAAVFQINPMSIAIVVAWIGGLFLINKARKNPAFNVTSDSKDKLPGRKHQERRTVENHVFFAKKSTLHVVIIFLIASIATLISGVLLEETGTKIADTLHIGSGLFAATAIALVTSLPEISTGLESIFIGDNHLAIADIMGGNAVMLLIFLMADLVAGQPVLSYDLGLPTLTPLHTDVLLTILSIVMMGIYAIAFIHPPQFRILRMGWDSIWQVIVYIAGMIGFNMIQ